ncbi:NAD(P)-binding domain-containing protein [Bacillus badius]|uniref:Secreted protein n=1 Tax=Bacillus badius TaxID=1455 RepID=A0ABR5ANX6_BACBA|nr:NAD(P)-binding domain-containing protein [Bacillus badius]KIL72945.1 putative secreted protein [Bacillus badius]MED4714878.1 NAD(P)-binding domain-containing protein [Bacillus badius]
MKFNIIQPSNCCDPGTGGCEPALPVAVIGAGPIGLAAAAHLTERKIPFFLLEKGEVAANVRTWEHVTLFSPWQYNMDEAGKRLLFKIGWQAPNEESIPTGKELLEGYLTPLAKLFTPNIYTNHEVAAITRDGLDRMKTTNRSSQPFLLYVETPSGLRKMKAKAVIDATGTWGNPNPAISNSVWLRTEKELALLIDYHIPNVETNKELYANKRIAVVGGGHSAINSLLNLIKLKQNYPDTSVTWILRKKRVEEAFGGGLNDELAARGELGLRIAKAVRKGLIQVETPFMITDMRKQNGIVLLSNEKILEPFDRLIVNTGNRPNFDFHRELRFEREAITEAVPALAPLIDPNEHSCGSVPAHGEKELRQPESNFYIVGSKSYGRAPTFLMATGYEQVRSVVAFLAGDKEAAANVQLQLPETGVCHSGAGGCC